MKVLITGGCGFIGSALIRFLIAETSASILNLDKLTYAADPRALQEVSQSPRYRFEQVDIVDRQRVRKHIEEFSPDKIINLAAESHVDRSIDSPAAFVQTNVVGTVTLLEESSEYWRNLPEPARRDFRFHHVSTDEVFGSLGDRGRFTEASAYAPNSPYSASKAASDHFVRAWGRTYGLPVLISNCSNNYGPWQFPEKLVPLISINGILGQPLPVYGDGGQIRDWVYVEDHAEALWQIATRGRPGESYNVGGNCELRNLDMVERICDLLDDRCGLLDDSASRRRLIQFVQDRPGHDYRYAIDAMKLETELDWTPRTDWAAGLAKTVDWYLANRHWWEDHLSASGNKPPRLGLCGNGDQCAGREG